MYVFIIYFTILYVSISLNRRFKAINRVNVLKTLGRLPKNKNFDGN